MPKSVDLWKTRKGQLVNGKHLGQKSHQGESAKHQSKAKQRIKNGRKNAMGPSLLCLPLNCAGNTSTAARMATLM